MPVPSHPSFNSSRLVRSLAGLGIADVADSPHTFAERLSAWVGWTDAPVLSAALATDVDPQPAAQAGEERRGAARRGAAGAARTGARNRTRCRLCRHAGAAWPAGCRRTAVTAPADGDFDPSFGRRRHAVLQQAMEDRIRGLRERVRAVLAGTSPPLARLAALDAAFEQALAPRERPLLGGAAVLVEAHFERRREARAGDARRAAACRRVPARDARTSCWPNSTPGCSRSTD